MHITLENVGSSQATNVTAILSTSDSHAVISDNSQYFGTIADGNVSTENDAFTLTVSDDIPDQYKAICRQAAHECGADAIEIEE